MAALAGASAAGVGPVVAARVEHQRFAVDMAAVDHARNEERVVVHLQHAVDLADLERSVWAAHRALRGAFERSPQFGGGGAKRFTCIFGARLLRGWGPADAGCSLAAGLP